jgi:FKBP-type peptidyl-prolyl cis-trans isomerase
MTVKSSKLRLLPQVGLIALALVVPGCGDDESTTTDQATQPGTTEPATTAEATTPTQTTPRPETRFPKAEKVAPAPGEGDPNRKPKVAKGEGNPPSKLVVQDLIVGKGKRAKAGQTVAVQYAGVLFKNGKEFDASWKGSRRGPAFGFRLGEGQVIAGWDQGVQGMKVGGRRKLIVPADLGYGPQGFPPDIPPNAALIFVIDLEKVYR